jgi:hypothetical protein
MGTSLISTKQDSDASGIDQRSTPIDVSGIEQAQITNRDASVEKQIVISLHGIRIGSLAKTIGLLSLSPILFTRRWITDFSGLYSWSYLRFLRV